jgi:transposase
LYAIEERGRLLTPSNRLELRQQEALPVWGRMKAWCDQLPRERMLPKSPFGKAVTYLTNQWTALQVYLSDGRIPIDNISSERTLRPWTIGRKNWLFLGHPEAAERRLQLYSVVSSAVRHQLVLQDYLSDAFSRLSQAQQQSPRDLELGSDLLLSLLPDRWAAAHPESICVGRREESRHRSEVVRMKRARYRLGNQP